MQAILHRLTIPIATIAECLHAAMYEIFAGVYSAWNWSLGKGELRLFGLNPSTLTQSQMVRGRAILVLHGSCHNQSGAIPIAKALHAADMGPVFTFNSTEATYLTDLCRELERVHSLFGQPIEVDLVGHSLGVIAAAEYAFTPVAKVEGVTVRRIISVAGRMNADSNRMRFMFEDLVPQLEALDRALTSNPEFRKQIYCIAAGRDWLVPQRSVLVGDHHLVVWGRSHLSVLYAQETIDQIVRWLQQGWRVPVSGEAMRSTMMTAP